MKLMLSSLLLTLAVIVEYGLGIGIFVYCLGGAIYYLVLISQDWGIGMTIVASPFVLVGAGLISWPLHLVFSKIADILFALGQHLATEAKKEGAMDKKTCKFESGRVCTGPRVARDMASNNAFMDFVYASFRRHMQCDWGEVFDNIKKQNDRMVKCGGPLLSVYKRSQVPDKTFISQFEYDLPELWILTEPDRSATTVLYPDEYEESYQYAKAERRLEELLNRYPDLVL